MQEDRALASSQLQEPIERRRSPVAAKMPEVVRSLPYLALQERSLPPNGSRLSCGRPAHRRKDVERQSVPARAQHSVSLTAITARQLQALVRRPRLPGSNLVV